MSVLDPISSAPMYQLFSDEIFEEMFPMPHVTPRRHSIAGSMQQDLEQFSQSFTNPNFDRVKSMELQSSVCDIPRKRRTSFCCNVEPGTSLITEPPRKRRLR